jgi:hypothetical protein
VVTRVVKAFAVALAVLAVTVGCGTGRPAVNQQRTLVEDTYTKASGGVLLALPMTLPEGYELTRIWSVANIYGETGVASSLARSAEFSGPQGTVRVCEELASVPGSLCPRSNVGLTAARHGLVRTVSTEVRPKAAEAKATRAAWGALRYSRAVSKWSWM